MTLRGYLDRGKATSAVCAGGGGGAEGVTGGERVEEAERAETAARTARCCGGSDTSCCVWPVMQQA